MMSELDPYYYARDHAQGPGAWCVCGPNGFKITAPGMSKGDAYVIGKILSGRHAEAAHLLAIEIICRGMAALPEPIGRLGPHNLS